MAKPIKIEILGDAKGFRGALGQADSGIGKLLKPLAGLGAAIGGAFAVSKIVDFGGTLFNLASDLTDINQKISTVFEGQTDTVRKWADGLNESFGVTSTSVALMAANVADLLKPMGATTEEATNMSQKLVELSPALAEWSGGTATAAEVSEILAKAILGEREQLKGLGISINQAEVDTRALAVAQADGRDEITGMDKALATQQLIFEKSTDAQAGYVEGTTTLAGKSNLLKARFAELKEFLAQKLIPVFSTITDQALMFVEALRTGQSQDEGTFIEKVAFFIRDHVVPIFTEFRVTLRSLAGALQELWDNHGPKIVDAFEGVRDIFTEAIKFLDENREVLIAIGVVAAAAFGAWAISAGLAALATLAAAAPFIALTVAVTAFVALAIKAYQENDRFRAVIDKIADIARTKVWPALKALATVIRNDVIPWIVRAAQEVGGWIATFVRVTVEVTKFVAGLVAKFVKLVTDIKNKGSDIYNAITQPFRDAIEWITDKWDALKRKLTGGISIPNPFSGFSLPGFAMGTSSAPGGFATVGERGRENVFLPRGARVQPAHLSRGDGPGGDTYVINGSNATASQLAAEIAWRKRIGDGR